MLNSFQIIHECNEMTKIENETLMTSIVRWSIPSIFFFWYIPYLLSALQDCFKQLPIKIDFHSECQVSDNKWNRLRLFSFSLPQKSISKTHLVSEIKFVLQKLNLTTLSRQRLKLWSFLWTISQINEMKDILWSANDDNDNKRKRKKSSKLFSGTEIISIHF